MRLWTDEEIGTLLDNPNMPSMDIAQILGRTRRSVDGKRHKIKHGHVSSREAWTDSQDDFILANPGMKARVVAEHLGRAKTAIDKRRQILTTRHGVSFDFNSNKNPHETGDRRLLAKTCPDCGLLLEAHWFGLSHEGHGHGWRKQCTRCRPRSLSGETRKPWPNADTKANRERLQAASLPTATKHGQPWTEADHEVLSNPDLTVIQKAFRLNRTYYATSSACADGGYRSRLGKGDPMKGVWVIDNPNAPDMRSAS